MIAIDTGKRNSWKWRLFIPRGHRYAWYAASRDIPYGVPPPTGYSGASNQPYWKRDNEVLVTAQLKLDSDGESLLVVRSRIGDSEHQMSGVTLAVPTEDLVWMADTQSFELNVLGTTGTVLVDPAEPVVLLSKRPMKTLPNGTVEHYEEPCPGLMVWLAPP